MDGANIRSSSSTKAAVDLYRYDKIPGQWTHVQPYLPDSSNHENIPLSRWAHQVTYDYRSKVFYLHGGKTGILIGAPHDGGESHTASNVESRLDDLWSMRLKR